MKPKDNIIPSRKLYSTIIKSNHIPLFASWIDKKDSSYYNNNQGPSMGNLYCLYSNNWNYHYNNGEYYPNIGIPANFEVEDYEVFQVIKNKRIKYIIKIFIFSSSPNKLKNFRWLIILKKLFRVYIFTLNQIKFTRSM